MITNYDFPLRLCMSLRFDIALDSQSTSVIKEKQEKTAKRRIKPTAISVSSIIEKNLKIAPERRYGSGS